MNLYIYDTTLREICRTQSTFPVCLREIICQSVKDIHIEEMKDLLSKPEIDPNNFDGRIEANIRSHSSGDITIFANHPVSNHTKFNCDLAIYSGNDSVCLEIEKGYLSRFELDILKMQAFADTAPQKTPQRQVYGAFIVPADNVVAGHITGNHNESSYEYLNRLSHLLCEMKSLPLSDILIVGYSETELIVKEEGKAKKKPQTIASNAQVEKIGQYARRIFNQWFSGKKRTPEMLENLQDATYSRETFRMAYPILKRIEPNKDEQWPDNELRKRYWRPKSWSQECDNVRYLLCSQWYKRHRENLTRWADQFGIE